LSSESGGTGQIIAAIKNDEIDLGIALTDALIAGIANGNKDYLLVGQYVTTPLNWSVRPLEQNATIYQLFHSRAVIVGQDSKYKQLADLRGTTIGISRIGRSIRHI
jgi:ABC-type phosphate/phosphonate transport system substrate-binding protein